MTRAQTARLLELAATAQAEAATAAAQADGASRERLAEFAATELPSFEELWGEIEPALGDRGALAELMGRVPAPLRRAAVALLHEEIRHRPRRGRLSLEERSAAVERVARQMARGSEGADERTRSRWRRAWVAEREREDLGGAASSPGIASREAPYAVRTVGDSCTYVNIQAAVNAASDGDIIRVQGKTFTGADATINVVGKSLSFFGGYNSDCTVHNAGRTVLDATGRADSVFEFWGGGVPEIATIDYFEITGGEPEGDGSGGGGIEIDDAFEVAVHRSYIHGNASTDGGGVHLAGGAADFYLREESLIYDNEASGDGGGIYCSGGSTYVKISGSSSVGFWFLIPFPNTAGENGGGVAGGCNWNLDASGGAAAILSNTAAGSGGGAYLPGGSLTSTGDESTVSDNSAVLGGGIYAASGANVQLRDVAISGNSADQGGGIYADGATTLTNLKTLTGPPCGQGKCAELSNNTATLEGGGQYVHVGPIAFLKEVFAENNQAGGEGSLLYMEVGNTATLESVMATANQGGSTIYLADSGGSGPNAVVNSSTFAENTGQSATFEVAANATLAGDGLVVWGNAGALASGTGATTIDCSILQSAYAGVGNVVGDPDFEDAVGGDYHLRASSPAVDHCSDGPTRDADYDSRPVDIRGTLTDYDAGADEGTFANLIFYDGFESEDTSAWSDTQP